MARKQAQDYDRKRDAIVETAARLFARRGFMGVSVSDLAAACDTSKSLIYHYYPSKEDILHAVMASHIEQLLADVEEASQEAEGPRERLNRLVHLFMRDYVGAADRQKVLLNELERLPEDRRRVIVGQQREIIRAVASLLREIEPDLKDDPTSAKVRAMMLFGMINWTHAWYDPAGPVPPDAIAELAFRLATGAVVQTS